MKAKLISIVGWPAPAVVGGVAGATGPPPQKVVSYVREQSAPADVVVVDEPLVVGQPLVETVVVVPVPGNPKYAYAIVNHKRVIVELSLRKVIQIID